MGGTFGTSKSDNKWPLTYYFAIEALPLFAAYAPPPNMNANRIPTVITAITGKTINTSKIMTAHVNFPITYS
jgi:hypothetical protein